MSDVIDFMPTEISEMVERDGYISVVMPCQPCYSQMTEETLPCYSCEIRIYGGKIELMDASFPFEGELSGIEYKDGWRGCFLPFYFMVDGPVHLSFSNDTEAGNIDVPKSSIIIKGDFLSLIILEKVGHYVSDKYGDYCNYLET